MSKEKRERAIAQNGNEGTHYTMTIEELQMLTETFTNDYVQQDVAKERKETPIFSGVLKYFPDAIAEVAKCSFVGQQQHNPDKPLAWDRSKSGDEYDALMRHLVDATVDDYDTDGTLHLAKVAWRSLAGLQKHLENLNPK
tara:strand:- start:200 stop:619 length:420 start_codon:yes stop_codon:yes gene_type:complete